MSCIRWFVALAVFAIGCGGTTTGDDVDADVQDGAVAETSSDRSAPSQDGLGPGVDGTAFDSGDTGGVDASLDRITIADVPSEIPSPDDAGDKSIPPDIFETRDVIDALDGAMGDIAADTGHDASVLDGTPFDGAMGDIAVDTGHDASVLDGTPFDTSGDGVDPPRDVAADPTFDASSGDDGADGAVDGGCASSCNLVAIMVTPANPTLFPRSTTTFQATGSCADSSICDVTTVVAWSTSNAAVAVVSNAAGTHGLVTAMNTGSATITASLGGVSGGSGVTITSGEPVALYVTPVGRSFAKGFHLPFVATLVFNDGTIWDVTGGVIWTSSAPTVASIGSDGVAFGLALGTTTIKADVSWMSGTASVNVLTGTLVSVTVEPASLQIPAGVPSQLRAIGHFSDASTQDLTDEATWGSSDVTHATVSDAVGTKGRTSAIAPGAATMTATVGAIMGTSTVDVSTATLVSIAPSIRTTELVLNMTLPMHVLGTYSDSTTFDLADLATWSSSSNVIADVGGPAVTAAGVGGAAIGVTFGGLSASFPVRVRAAVLDRVELTPVNPTVNVLASMAMHATAFYADGMSIDVTDLVAYTTSDPSVAAIGNIPGMRGILTGLAPGTSALGVYYNGGGGGTTVTVSP